MKIENWKNTVVGHLPILEKTVNKKYVIREKRLLKFEEN